MEQIRARDVTENVVELVAGKIDQLAEETRTALRLAACLGNTFDLVTLGLAHGAGRSAPEDDFQAAAILRRLWPAIHAGLVFPVDGRALDLLYADSGGEDLDCRFKFAHDRVQQAAYGSLDAAQREALHLEIGRRLSAASGGETTEDRLFETVHQWNQALGRPVGKKTLESFGIELPESDAEIRELWESDLSTLRSYLAGRRIAELVDAPRMNDEPSKRLMKFLNGFAVVAFLANHTELTRWASAR